MQRSRSCAAAQACTRASRRRTPTSATSLAPEKEILGSTPRLVKGEKKEFRAARPGQPCDVVRASPSGRRPAFPLLSCARLKPTPAPPAPPRHRKMGWLRFWSESLNCCRRAHMIRKPARTNTASSDPFYVAPKRTGKCVESLDMVCAACRATLARTALSGAPGRQASGASGSSVLRAGPDPHLVRPLRR